MKKLSITITFLSVSLFSQTYQMEWQFPAGYISIPFHNHASMDYNGDGFADIFISEGDSSIIIIDPTANYSEILSFQYPHAYAGGSYFCDMNGDSNKEIILNTDPNGWYVTHIINTDDFSAFVIDSFRVHRAGDFDNDGKDEIFGRNYALENRREIWGDASTTASSVYETIPSNYALNQNYPNPFNPNTIINYQVQLSGNIELSIFDIRGRKIRKLVNEQKSVGDYQIKWDGTNDSGDPLSSGQYFYQLKVGDFISTKKMVLLK
jgi:hypothetical protein